MKIVQLVTQMEAGGAQRVALQLAEELRQRGHQSEVWFLYTKRSAFEGQLGVKSLYPSVPGGTGYIRIAASLARELWRARPNVLITHTHYANVIGQAVGRLLGVKQRIAVQHNPCSTYPRVARLADHVWGEAGVYSYNVAVSQHVAQDFSRTASRSRTRMLTIPNGIAEVQPTTDAAHWRARLGLAADTPLLVNVGRLAAQKNQQFLVALLSRLPDVHLAIAGEGEERPAIEAQAHNLGVGARLHLCGELAQPEAFSLLTAADVFVFPSRYEAMPLALLEAMRACRPVVASRIPATEEFLGNDGYALDLDLDTWRVAVTAILSNPQEHALMVERARLSADRFSISRMGDAYEALFAY